MRYCIQVMEVGEMWAYRERPRALDCPVVQAEILQFGPRRSGKVRVRLRGGDYPGLDVWVPAVRLRVPWADKEAWLRDERALAAAGKASEGSIGCVASEAANIVFYAYPGPGEIMAGWPLKAGTLCITRPEEVAAWLGVSLDSLLSEPLAFIDHTGEYYAPAEIGHRLARLTAQSVPEEPLARVAKEEEELREQAIHGRYFNDGPSLSGYIPPERRAEYLREREPVFALVHEWCGRQAVERFDELVALRKEVRRLHELLKRGAERLEAAGHPEQAAWLRRQADGRAASRAGGSRKTGR